MPSSRPGCLCLRLPVDMGESAQVVRSLASRISAADFQGQLPMSQSTSGFTTR